MPVAQRAASRAAVGCGRSARRHSSADARHAASGRIPHLPGHTQLHPLHQTPPASVSHIDPTNLPGNCLMEESMPVLTEVDLGGTRLLSPLRTFECRIYRIYTLRKLFLLISRLTASTDKVALLHAFTACMRGCCRCRHTARTARTRPSAGSRRPRAPLSCALLPPRPGSRYILSCSPTVHQRGYSVEQELRSFKIHTSGLSLVPISTPEVAIVRRGAVTQVFV